MKNYLTQEVKDEILSKIFEHSYKEVMRQHLDGINAEDIAYKVGYSVRQVQRIVSLCWKEVCIYFACENTGDNKPYKDCKSGRWNNESFTE